MQFHLSRLYKMRSLRSWPTVVGAIDSWHFFFFKCFNCFNKTRNSQHAFSSSSYFIFNEKKKKERRWRWLYEQLREIFLQFWMRLNEHFQKEREREREQSSHHIQHNITGYIVCLTHSLFCCCCRLFIILPYSRFNCCCCWKLNLLYRNFRFFYPLSLFLFCPSN